MSNEGMRNLLTAIILCALRDVYEHDVLKKRPHTKGDTWGYSSAVNYLTSGRADADLSLLGFDISGKELLKKAQSGKIHISYDNLGL